MKKWISLIFLINTRLEQLAEKLDLQIKSVAFDGSIPCADAYEKILKYNDYKVRIINLKVLHDRFSDTLPGKERAMLEQFIGGSSLQEIAEKEQRNKSFIYRSIEKSFHRCAQILFTCGYDEQRMEQEYGENVFIHQLMKKIKRQNRRREGRQSPSFENHFFLVGNSRRNIMSIS